MLVVAVFTKAARFAGEGRFLRVFIIINAAIIIIISIITNAMTDVEFILLTQDIGYRLG
jgi:hypothetical protein